MSHGHDCSKVRWRRRADFRSKGEHSQGHLERFRLNMASSLIWAMGVRTQDWKCIQEDQVIKKKPGNQKCRQMTELYGNQRGVVRTQPLGGRSLARGEKCWQALKLLSETYPSFL